jgi:uncharacterized protein (DUF1778 family)
MRQYTVILSDEDYTLLMDALWYAARQREKLERPHQQVIEDVRTQIKRNRLTVTED